MSFKTFDATKARQYPAFTLYPFLHRSGPMPWAAAAVLDMSKVDKLIFLSGQTGRDPETDRRPNSWDEERSGVGTVVGPGVKEQTTGCWTRIKETLDGLGVSMNDIFFITYYIVNPDDYWDMHEATRAFWREHAPDLLEHTRADTLIRGIGLALRKMLIEIEVIAVTSKK